MVAFAPYGNINCNFNLVHFLKYFLLYQEEPWRYLYLFCAPFTSPLREVTIFVNYVCEFDTWTKWNLFIQKGRRTATHTQMLTHRHKYFLLGLFFFRKCHKKGGQHLYIAAHTKDSQQQQGVEFSSISELLPFFVFVSCVFFLLFLLFAVSAPGSTRAESFCEPFLILMRFL